MKLTGKGYVCVLTEAEPRWEPAMWVKPWLNDFGGSDAESTMVSKAADQQTEAMADCTSPTETS